MDSENVTAPRTMSGDTTPRKSDKPAWDRKRRGEAGMYERDTVVEPYEYSKGEWV